MQHKRHSYFRAIIYYSIRKLTVQHVVSCYATSVSSNFDCNLHTMINVIVLRCNQLVIIFKSWNLFITNSAYCHAQLWTFKWRLKFAVVKSNYCILARSATSQFLLGGRSNYYQIYCYILCFQTLFTFKLL